jgi:hypothetical protein
MQMGRIQIYRAGSSLPTTILWKRRATIGSRSCDTRSAIAMAGQVITRGLEQRSDDMITKYLDLTPEEFFESPEDRFSDLSFEEFCELWDVMCARAGPDFVKQMIEEDMTILEYGRFKGGGGKPS